MELSSRFHLPIGGVESEGDCERRGAQREAARETEERSNGD